MPNIVYPSIPRRLAQSRMAEESDALLDKNQSNRNAPKKKMEEIDETRLKTLVTQLSHRRSYS
jgi:hypothetical protein